MTLRLDAGELEVRGLPAVEYLHSDGTSYLALPIDPTQRGITVRADRSESRNQQEEAGIAALVDGVQKKAQGCPAGAVGI